MKKPKREISPEVLALKRQYNSCFIILFASFLIGLAVSVLLDIPIGVILTESTLMSENPTLAQGIRNFSVDIAGLVGTLITIFVLSFRDGYYNNKFVFKQLLLSITLVFVTQVVLVLILGHSVWFSGPTTSLASDVFKVRHFDIVGQRGSKRILISYKWCFMIPAFWVLYAPIMVAGKYLGAKKSKKNFAINKEEKTKEKTINEHPFDV